MRRLYLAGIGNSGPQHWQAIWHASRHDGTWVEHSHWEVVSKNVWVREMHATLEQIEPSNRTRTDEPLVLIAHSLGCLLAAEYLTQHGASRVSAALLVAVPDVEGPAFPATATGFRPARELTMPVPSILVASHDDPYGSCDYVHDVAKLWGSRVHEVGALGHINADSKLGHWPQGAALVEALRQLG